MSAKPFALAAVTRLSIASDASSAKGRLSVTATIRKSAAKLSAAALGELERASGAVAVVPPCPSPAG